MGVVKLSRLMNNNEEQLLLISVMIVCERLS